ncbi:putative glutaredoxin.1 [mine drainage metagenome]|uniref:Putative glutaredoxin.1 n=1 Tax=mine drainage metagenome TaxID=410659 RepID=A0A1J5Q4J4_9ZZZZ
MITFYGANWCGDCRRSKRLLDGLGVKYTYVDVEKEASATETVMKLNNGAQSIPVIVFPDNTHLTEPSDNALRAKLAALKII